MRHDILTTSVLQLPKESTPLAKNPLPNTSANGHLIIAMRLLVHEDDTQRCISLDFLLDLSGIEQTPGGILLAA